jgi:lipid-A-disaccharide synthase
MLDAIAILLGQKPDLQFCVTIAPTRTRDELEAMISKSKAAREKIILVENETRSAIASAEVAIVASGTATLETALLHTPLAVVYKVSSHNWHTLRHLINVPHYGLVNLVAGERLATELIQNDCNGKKIAEEILRLLNPEVNANIRERLSAVTRKLGDGGASRRAAEIVWKFLKNKNS